ncbi:MAG TPA: bifunctional diaminohydroxyphosphoribosylaminopyrimidine deaminase/5-amino-6-(5-phosphoribosylamino)uracil reductase RibD [Bacteroidetes bacterium]|nr:riboflavin biosynthesis protein RibD [bacterium BMS3Bbin04]HDO64733.1 bifunctional diaminohydroxyphosphoribosylaminopyrimidine deaminase/5-amino-6-(5-phosphoribosylamino)uracil reductase RibD [Bacteroidota bacterium]HEX03858.1 bifunctional diaminohydroxyphosphoribosylaminopyrimidine deaminase/5-amino-6-(5-phosphoribosylamino)uracil reductase RibD [Bacteroidota bacterium]
MPWSTSFSQPRRLYVGAFSLRAGKLKEKSLDELMMARAISLARRGAAWVAPNPMVGAVVVKDGQIVGDGYHRRFGGPHAEVHALRKSGKQANGATLYVNLEPCCHYGKTPPCTDRILEAGIVKVYAAIEDPNPEVNGKGFAKLREAGVKVEVGLMATEAEELNLPYLKKAATGMTWITLKIAQSLDGRIASVTGHSQWISGKKSQRYAHLLRATHDAILVGIGTVNTDDCSLTVRHVSGRNPIRIVLDSHFSIDPECKLLNNPDDAPTWVFGLEGENDPDWSNRPNVRLFKTRPDEGRVDLGEVHRILSELGVGSLLVEGGSHVWTSFLDRDLVDKVEVIVAPMLIGTGIEAINNLGILKVHDAIRLQPIQWRKIGDDLHIAARVLHSEKS